MTGARPDNVQELVWFGHISKNGRVDYYYISTLITNKKKEKSQCNNMLQRTHGTDKGYVHTVAVVLRRTRQQQQQQQTPKLLL
jgi:hypothetical protein